MASSARIDELRKKFDENPRRYFAPLANEYRKSGDLEQAIFICQEYLPQQPGHMSGHIVYGQALYELARLDEARAVFETALSLDPENLIALRHLGDIARQSGDTRGARVWYQRVLEADPRNEEIAQIMMTLLATPDASAPAVNSIATLDSTPTLEMPTRLPTPGMGAIAVENAGGGNGFETAPELSTLRQSPDEPPPVPTSTWGETDKSAAELELLDLDDFSVGGIPLSSLGAPPPEIEHLAPPPSEASSLDSDVGEFEAANIAESAAYAAHTPHNEEADTGGFNLGQEAEPFEADPLAIAATHEVAATPEPISAPEWTVDEAPIELASDVDLGLPEDGQAATTFSASAAEPLADLETYDESIIGAEATEPSPIEVDTFFAGMAHESFREPEGESLPLVSNLEDTPTAIGVIDTPESVDTVPPISRETPPSVEAITPSALGASEASPFERSESSPFEATAPESFETPETSAFEMSESASFETPESSFEIVELPPLGTPVFVDAVIERPIEGAESFDVVPPMPVETPISVDAIEATPVWTPPEPEPAVPASEEFVTETMAELYLEQGHLEAAIEIYQQLVAQHPEDGQLAERLAAVESTLRGENVNAFPDDTFASTASAGPTIRDFLAGLLRPIGGFTPQAAEPEASDEFSSMETPISTPRVDTPVSPPHIPTPVYIEAIDSPRMPTPVPYIPVVESSLGYEEMDILDSPQSPIDSQTASLDAAIGAVDGLDFDLAAPPRQTPAAPLVSLDAPAARIPGMRPAIVRGTPVASETVSGSIDALFLGAGASASDATAATTLSQAFAAETPEPTPAKPLQGVPAHAASSELSLDHVFKTTSARRQEAEGDGFSFDQFFADELSDGTSKPGTEPPSTPGKGGPGSGGGDDIAQFNNWLNGLKKT